VRSSDGLTYRLSRLKMREVILNAVQVNQFQVEFLVVCSEFQKSLTEHALEYIDRCVIQFRLVIHVVPA